MDLMANLSTLRGWFCDEKYLVLQGCGASGFAWLMRDRAFRLGAVRSGIFSDCPSALTANFLSIFDKNDPLLPCGFDHVRSVWNIVKPLSVSDVFALDNDIREGFYEPQMLAANMDDWDQPVDFFLDGECCHLTLDLSVDDETLMSELRKFLPDFRNKLKNLKSAKSHAGVSINPALLQKMKSYKVIQYWDIQIWSELTGKVLSDRERAEFLFPNRDDAGTFFAQTVKPFIRKVSNGAVIDSLFLNRFKCQ